MPIIKVITFNKRLGTYQTIDFFHDFCWDKIKNVESAWKSDNNYTVNASTVIDETKIDGRCFLCGNVIKNV